MVKLTMGDLYSPETQKNPFAFYEQLHKQEEPLFYIDDVYGMGAAWVATRYDDVIAILKDPRFIKDGQKISQSISRQVPFGDNSAIQALLTWPNMLTVDPPDHTRLRSLVSKAFTPRMIEQLRPSIQQITDELLDTIEPQGKMDLLTNFAYPLPLIVISDMLGIPRQDRQQFHSWTQTIMKTSTNPQLLADPAVVAAAESFIQYIKTLLGEKRKQPGNDLTSGLVQTEERGDSLSEAELISTIWLLIIAGHETTANLIGNGMLTLLQHPGQMNSLRQDISLLPSAVEELLRHASSVMVGNRLAREDIPMHGNVIRKGEMVLFSLTGANLDPRQFSDPEQFNIARQEQKHLAFGKGIHVCLGAPLARLEGQIAFETLLKRLPNLRLDCKPEELTWSRTKFRALASLPVTF